MRRFAAPLFLLAGFHACAHAADSPGPSDPADTCAAPRPRLDVLKAALRRHPEGRLDGSRVTWPLRDGRSFTLEREQCDGGATIATVHSPQGFDDDWYAADLAQLLREYVSMAVGDELDTRLHDRRRWFEAPIDDPSTQEVVDPEPGPAFPAGVFVEWHPDRINVLWPDHASRSELKQMRELRDTQHRMLDGDDDDGNRRDGDDDGDVDGDRSPRAGGASIDPRSAPR